MSPKYTPAFSLFAVALLFTAAQAATSIDIGTDVLRPETKRFGICLAQHNYYDSHQMMKELLLRNPGFEGLLYQSLVRLGPGGAATSAIEEQAFGQWPTGFWAGASYEIVSSNTGARGRAGTIANSIAPNRVPTPNDPAGSTQGTTYLFSDSGIAPGNGDFLLLRHTLRGTGGGVASGSWDISTTGGGSISSEPSDSPPGSLGQQSVRLSALTAGQQAMISGRFDTLQGFVRLNGQFRLAFKAKGAGGANRVFVNVRRGSTSYFSQAIQLGGDWAEYNLPFPQPVHEPETISGTVSVEFSATGQSALLLDDVSLRQTDSDPGNPTEFRDGVVNALRELRPGILRYVNWQMLGNTLDNDLAPIFARRRSGYSVYGTSENNLMPGLHEFLVLAEHIGADPWISLPATSSIEEMTHLMEYLGGDETTAYGQIRVARGHAQPWTEVFSRIHLEFGNEHWNPAFRGGVIHAADACGARANEMFAAVKASPHYLSTQIQCILGGQSGNPASALQFHNASAQHDSFALGPYLSGRVDNYATTEELFGPLFAEPEWWSTNPTPTTGLMRLQFNNLQSSRRPVPISVYEVNLHTTQGAISQAALDSYTPSVGAAVAVADHMLVMLRELGAVDQCMMSLAGHRYTWGDGSGKSSALWGVTLDMDKTHRRRPTFYALRMLNDVLGGEMLQTAHTGDNSTWNQPLLNRVGYTGAHHVQSFAFRQGNARHSVVFNLHRTNPLEVNFAGPGAPRGAVSLQQLTSANITDHNEAAMVVAPVEQTLPDFDPEQNLSLPPFSMTVLSWSDGAPVLSNQANLSGLGLSTGSLDPAFASETPAYTASINYPVMSILVHPAAVDANATIQVRANGGPYRSAESALNMSIGANKVEVLVTAQDGFTQKLYTIAVTRRPAPLAQMIEFALPTAVYLSQGSLTLHATASSGLPVTLSVVTGPATLTGNQLTLTAPGTVQMQAVQAGNDGYEAASPVIRSMVVLADPESLTFTGLRQTYDGKPKAVSANGDGPVTITYTIEGLETAVPPVNAGRYPVKAVAGALIEMEVLEVDKAPLTVTADDKTKLTGDPNPALTATLTGFAGADTESAITKLPVLITTAKGSSPPGEYPITVSGAESANYSFTYVQGTLFVETFAGNYEALLTDDTPLPAAKLTVNVARTNASFSARLFTAAETRALSFRGSLSIDRDTGQASGHAETRLGGVLYTVAVVLPTTGPVAMTAERDGVTLGSSTIGTKLPSLRNVAYHGTHTAILHPAAPAGETVPAGAGWATASIAANGTLTLRGRLGDGAGFSTSLAPDGEEDPGYRIFCQPYIPARPGTYVAGEFRLAAHPDHEHRRFLSSAPLTWVKAQRTADSSYRAGFGPVSTELSIDPWQAPLAATRTKAAVTLAQRLGLSGPPSSIEVTQSPTGSVSHDLLPTSVALAANHTLSVVAPLTSPVNATKWRGTVSVRTGTFSGSFELSDNGRKRRVGFSGVLRQAPSTSTDDVIGDGHYLLPALPGAVSNEKVTGGVFLQKPQN